ncbi:hypothetical protein Tco_0598054 [Tanacetum coccineum]
MALTAYVDADHAGCQDTRRSTSGSAQFLGERLQLQTEAMFCYYDALLSSIEHKSYKDALTKSCWFDVMKSSMSSIIWRLGASTSSRSSDDYYLKVDL